MAMYRCSECGGLNRDENPQPSAQHGIHGIPALLLFRSGHEVGRQTGALPKSALDSWLSRYL